MIPYPHLPCPVFPCPNHPLRLSTSVPIAPSILIRHTSLYTILCHHKFSSLIPFVYPVSFSLAPSQSQLVHHLCCHLPIYTHYMQVFLSRFLHDSFFCSIAFIHSQLLMYFLVCTFFSIHLSIFASFCRHPKFSYLSWSLSSHHIFPINFFSYPSLSSSSLHPSLPLSLRLIFFPLIFSFSNHPNYLYKLWVFFEHVAIDVIVNKPSHISFLFLVSCACIYSLRKSHHYGNFLPPPFHLFPFLTLIIPPFP